MLNELAKEIHQNAIEHGWWDKRPTVGETIALCHAELSEALEEYRDGKQTTYCEEMATCLSEAGDNPDCVKCLEHNATRKPEGIAVELADCIIRILDFCAAYDIDIDTIIRIKHEYNKTRPYRHGGKIL